MWTGSIHDTIDTGLTSLESECEPIQSMLWWESEVCSSNKKIYIAIGAQEGT